MCVRYAEGNVTKLRREFKLVLPAELARTLVDQLRDELDEGESAPTLITSIYFDRPGFPLAARAISTPQDCLKVRTKEYFPDRHAEGAERVVVEVKREKNGLTQKRRVWFPRAQLRGVIASGTRVLPLIQGGRL